MKLTKGRILALMTLLAGSVFGQNNPIQITSATANVEGSIQLKWTSESNALYRIEYATELSDSMQWMTLYKDYPSQGTNTLWMDAGVYYQGNRVEHPRYSPQRFYRVVYTRTNDIAPPLVTVTAPTNGFVASGLLNISVSATNSSLPIMQIHLFVDGEEVRVSADNTDFLINTCEWPNGPHTIFASVEESDGVMSRSIAPASYTAGVSAPITVQFNNYISQYTFAQSWFKPSLGQTQNISAVFADYADWNLVISDPSSNVVQNISGTGYTMNVAWDGNDQAGNPTPTGRFIFNLSASTSTSSPPPPIGLGQTTNPPAGPSSFASSANNGMIELPMPPLPRGLEQTNTTMWVELPDFLSANQQSFSMTETSQDSSSQSQDAPQPSRPSSRPFKDTFGSFGVAAIQDYIPYINKPQNHLFGTVNIAGGLPLPPLGIIPTKMAENFIRTMEDGAVAQSFYRINDVTSSELTGRVGNIFNHNIDFGLLISHGVRGTTVDYITSTPSLQTYVPCIAYTGYDWVPLSSMKFGGSQLKWMGIHACEVLADANYSDMKNKNVLPIGPNLHLLMGGSTTIWGNIIFGSRLGELLTGYQGGIQGNPETVFNSWTRASVASHLSINTFNTNTITLNQCNMRIAGWEPCRSDTIYSYATDTGGSDDQSGIFDENPVVFQRF